MPPFPATWPAPHDPAAADRLIERFSELGRAEARLAARPAVKALLAALGGNSPYLSDLAVREAGALRAVVAQGPQAVVDDALATLHAVPPQSRREHLSRRRCAGPSGWSPWPPRWPTLAASGSWSR